MTKLAKGGSLFALLIATIATFEGIRQNAYPDPATGGAPWTVCYGHTEGVKPGDRYTLAECKELLRQDLETYAAGIERCVKVTLPDKRYVALVSFAYNVGVNAACGSSVVRLINVGRTREGCDALLLWDKAAGIRFPGLTKRRQRERAMCLEGLA